MNTPIAFAKPRLIDLTGQAAIRASETDSYGRRVEIKTSGTLTEVPGSSIEPSPRQYQQLELRVSHAVTVVIHIATRSSQLRSILFFIVYAIWRVVDERRRRPPNPSP